ncbi:unnamed protein product [Sphagnum troendelagicum]|jgi:hypothetical protein
MTSTSTSFQFRGISSPLETTAAACKRGGCKRLACQGFRNLLKTEEEQDAPQLLVYVSEMDGSPQGYIDIPLGAGDKVQSPG